MGDPVRDTRQAVVAARRQLIDQARRCGREPGEPCAVCARLANAYESAVETWARADEYRRIMDRGTDADAWGEAKK